MAEQFLDVDESAELFDGYELKLNSHDLGVDIELHDAMQRPALRAPGSEGRDPALWRGSIKRANPTDIGLTLSRQAFRIVSQLSEVLGILRSDQLDGLW